ncbi:MAG: hypothetical protein JSS28_01160 [Proteobacteria bacterium]|nr:hypothetical protein [Pseudomonadota bacterium]
MSCPNCFTLTLSGVQPQGPAHQWGEIAHLLETHNALITAAQGNAEFRKEFERMAVDVARLISAKWQKRTVDG